MAVHPDGTIFAIQYPEENAVPDSVIGLDPTTGAPKFTIQIPGSDKGETTVYGVIVAGDGYAYVPYGSREIDVIETNHLRLLRVNSSGASDDIDVYDWTSNIYDIFPFIFVGMITNADQGILLTWEDEEHWDPGNDYSDYSAQMAITTGTSASLVSTQQIGGAVFPVLQAQDGSFVAAGANPALYPASENAIFAFDASGNVRWFVPNDTPQIATADGGVIGQSGITYDQNGNATGMIGVPILSWTGNAYQWGGPASEVFSSPIDVATSLWAFAQLQDVGKSGANQSANGSAAPNPWLSLVGPTDATFKKAYKGTEKLNCSGKSQAPPIPVWYGNQECAAYKMMSLLPPYGQITAADTRFDEWVKVIDSIPGNVANTHGNGNTDSKGVLWDDLSLGFVSGPPQAGQFVLSLQVVMLHSTDTPVRVNCLDFEATATTVNVTVTEITKTYDPNVSPAKQCSRTTN